MGAQLNILLVDDDAADASLFARFVERSGLGICLRTLRSGKEAIDYLQAKGAYADRIIYPLPDVIVLDLRMPLVNGFDFLAWRKASGLFSAIPVVVFSGSSAPDEIRRVFDLGADRHIAKPKQFQSWREIVREIWNCGTEGTTVLGHTGFDYAGVARAGLRFDARGAFTIAGP